MTTNSNHNLKKYLNLIEDLVPVRTDQIWHADIIYIRITTSFVYLSALIDGFSRKVVGYGLGQTLSADLVMAALLDAISKRNTEGSYPSFQSGHPVLLGNLCKAPIRAWYKHIHVRKGQPI